MLSPTCLAIRSLTSFEVPGPGGPCYTERWGAGRVDVTESEITPAGNLTSDSIGPQGCSQMIVTTGDGLLATGSTDCVALLKFLDLSEPWFFFFKMRFALDAIRIPVNSKSLCF